MLLGTRVWLGDRLPRDHANNVYSYFLITDKQRWPGNFMIEWWWASHCQTPSGMVSLKDAADRECGLSKQQGVIKCKSGSLRSSGLQGGPGASTVAFPAFTSGLLPPGALPSGFSHQSNSKCKYFSHWFCTSERWGRLAISRSTETWQIGVMCHVQSQDCDKNPCLIAC